MATEEAASSREYWLKSGMFTLLQRFGVQFFGIGMAIVLFRVLSKPDMGAWVLFLTTVSILEVGRIGLQQNALIKFLAGCEEKEYSKISTASLALNVLITGIMIIVLLLLAHPLGLILESEELPKMLQIYCITTVLLIPYFQFNFVSQANLDFKGMFWSDFLKQGLLFLYILFVYLLGFKISLIDLALMQIVTAIIASITSWYLARAYIKFDRIIDWQWVSKLFHFGKYVLGTNLSTMLYKSIDKFMLGGLLAGPTAAVAVASYEAAIRITNMAEVPTFSMASMLFPQSARRMKEGNDAIRDLYEKAVGAIFALLIPGILIILVFAEPIIWIIAGEEYLSSANLLRLTILYGLFIPFAVQFGTVLDSIGKPKINFYFTLGGAALNIILNYVFILNFGIVGAAYGTLLTYLITFIFMQHLLNKMFKIKIIRVFSYMFGFYGQLLRIVKSKLKIAKLN